MEEKQKRAMDPNLSPQEKMAILEEIEEDGKLLKAKYEERNKLTNRFSHIDPSKHVSRLIERMKQAIEKSYGSGGSGGGRENPNQPNRPNKPGDGSGGNGGGSSDGLPDDDPNRSPRPRKEKPEKDNSQIILIAVAVMVILFLMTNQPKPQRDEEFDYYD